MYVYTTQLVLRSTAMPLQQVINKFIITRRVPASVRMHLLRLRSGHNRDTDQPIPDPYMDQTQRRLDDHGHAPVVSAHAQQAGPDKSRQQEQPPPPPPSSLNQTAARLLREATVSRPDGETPASSDILAFARSVDRVDSPLE